MKIKNYDPSKIEPKWQKEWEKWKIYEAGQNSKEKFYSLMEFPYPSGEGLHTGHVRGYTAMDIISRQKRMEGKNVLFPIGWDAFGLPTENYAIKTGKDPRVVTKKNTDNFRKQFKSLGMSFDWSREINTTDPKYYKWTQWIFLQMFKKGLAYKTKTLINWCPKDKIGLANEEVVNGCCERCGTEVEKREKEQWMLAITKYADRLDKDLDDVDYWEKIKIGQRNWIGRSEGAEIGFEIKFAGGGQTGLIPVFTTRPDTIFGVTALVLSPEHLWVTLALDENHKGVLGNRDEVRKYVEEARAKTDIERTSFEKGPSTGSGQGKTGVRIEGVTAVNPANGEEVPIFIADYVLASYGTGAVMSVPAYDERDLEFSQKYNLPIKQIELADKEEVVRKFGKKVVHYKLRDWVFSRQRYWGEPIPLINCEKCGWQPVPEEDLPVELPEVTKYQPTDNGESPLASVTKWVNVKCPSCGANARRETDTMPNWAGSSWYFLRYTDPNNESQFADLEKLDYWTPVDWYNGGMEHTTLHLLYSRFWHKFLYDLKLVPTSEPYKKRTSHGLILAEGGEKMSKSKGNVINPDDIVQTWGADSLRLYEMFMGPFADAIAWNTDNMIGVRRFLEKVWRMGQIAHPTLAPQDKKLESFLHKTIKKVGEDIAEMKFNTAISSMMILVNEMEKSENVSKIDFQSFLKLLAPFAPHMTEEIWSQMGNEESIHISSWPVFDPEKIKEEEVTIAVQINGRVRASFSAEAGIGEAEAKAKALSMEEIKKWIGDKEIKRVIFVSGKILNLVI